MRHFTFTVLERILRAATTWPYFAQTAKGYPCSGNNKCKGIKCVDTLVVTASKWAATEGSGDCVARAQESYVSGGVEEEEESPDGANTDDTPVRSLSIRTANHMLNTNPKD